MRITIEEKDSHVMHLLAALIAPAAHNETLPVDVQEALSMVATWLAVNSHACCVEANSLEGCIVSHFKQMQAEAVQKVKDEHAGREREGKTAGEPGHNFERIEIVGPPLPQAYEGGEPWKFAVLLADNTWHVDTRYVSPTATTYEQVYAWAHSPKCFGLWGQGAVHVFPMCPGEADSAKGREGQKP